MDIVKYILAIYSWAAIGLLLVFLGRIAYFYEKTSRQQTGYYLLVLPGLLLIAGVVWYLRQNAEFTGEPIGDLLLFSGGALLCLFGVRLKEFMTGERK
jgi:cbb3-type cytochrome oxidase subunit 3